MTNGKNKDVLRGLFKETNPNKEPINAKTQKPTKPYEDFLVKSCKPHWASVLSKFGKKIEQIDSGEVDAQTVLDNARKQTILEEKCSLGIGGKIATNKRLWESKYNIKF